MTDRKNKELILGLDISTSCVGCSLAIVEDGKDVNPVEVTHLKLRTPKKVIDNGVRRPITDLEVFFMKTDLFKEKMKEYAEKYIVDRVVIETPLTASNNAQTVSVLMRYNGVCSYICRELFDVIPEYISSYDARKFGMPYIMAVRKYRKNGNMIDYKEICKAIDRSELVEFGAFPYDIGKKDIVWSYISDKFPYIQWVTNTKGELAQENFDASDSLMCILGQVNKDRYAEEEPKVVSREDVVETLDSGEKRVVAIKYVTDFCGESFEKMIELQEYVTC